MDDLFKRDRLNGADFPVPLWKPMSYSGIPGWLKSPGLTELAKNPSRGPASTPLVLLPCPMASCEMSPHRA